MERTSSTEDVFNLGARLGRKQAFSLIAGRCSVAEIECLIEILENKLYLAVEPTWEDYCKNRLGTSRHTVERLIRQYRQMGPGFCRLSSFTRITPAEYRLIAPAVTEDGLSYNGETIPLEPENAPLITRAVTALRKENAPPPKPADLIEDAFLKAAKSLQCALFDLSRLRMMDLDQENRLRLLMAIETGQQHLEVLRRGTAL